MQAIDMQSAINGLRVPKPAPAGEETYIGMCSGRYGTKDRERPFTLVLVLVRRTRSGSMHECLMNLPWKMESFRTCFPSLVMSSSSRL